VAEAEGVTQRTLRNWKSLDPADDVRPPGRPRLTDAQLSEARSAVESELESQGWQTGEEPVFRALGERFARARVRRVLGELKAARRRRKREHERSARVSVKVHARDVLWSMDATHLGRDPGGRAVQAEVVREVASTRTIGISVGHAATGEEVVLLLELTVEQRGGPPLVLLTDNGGAYRSHIVDAWCKLHRVLHLLSLPRTPQHNAASEHGMLELKLDAALGKGTHVHDIGHVCAALARSRDRIDGHRLRQTRSWQTAVEADRCAPHWSSFVTRQHLWMKATCAIAEALLHSTGERARRRAVREAILATLHHFSVITRTRGGRPWTAQYAEDDS
jgi:transposase InsO family protein